MSSAQILWDNWNKYDDLDSVYRQGFLKIKAYGYGDEIENLIDKFHAESTLIHSARTAMFFSDMMDLWPSYFKDVDRYVALKVVLNHDIGELIVGDVCDDGRKAHKDKGQAEWGAVIEHYAKFKDETYLPYKFVHREFEDANTFLGQSIKLADKLDFLAKLIKMESQGYNLNNDEYYSKNDWRLGDEINRYEFIDIVANHLRHIIVRHHFDERLILIAIQFLTCGLKTLDRPFFEWWHVKERPINRYPH